MFEELSDECKYRSQLVWVVSTKLIMFLIDFLAWGPFGMGTVWRGDRLAWGLFGMGTVWRGDCLVWGPFGVGPFLKRWFACVTPML